MKSIPKMLKIILMLIFAFSIVFTIIICDDDPVTTNPTPTAPTPTDPTPTEPTPDTTPPELNAANCVPADSATGISVDITTITLEFNEAVDGSTGTFSISPSDDSETVSYASTSSDTVTLNVDNLQGATAYTVNISGVKDTSGNAMAADSISFTTLSDENPPLLDKLVCTPANGDIGVSSSLSSITLKFNENIDGSTGTYDISPSTNSEAVSYNSTTENNVYLDVSNLVCNTTYTINVSDVEDSYGNAMASGDSITFATTNDSTSPTMDKASSTGANNTTDVEYDITAITVVFNENIDGSTGTYILTPADVTVSYDSTAGDEVTITISGGTLTPGQEYDLDVSNVEDGCGNVMTADTLTFTARGNPEIDGPSCSPASGATGVVRVDIPNATMFDIVFDDTIQCVDDATCTGVSYSISPFAHEEDVSYDSFNGTDTITLAVSSLHCDIETYTITIQGIQDVYGETVDNRYYTFSIAADTSSRELYQSAPISGSSNINPNDPIGFGIPMVTFLFDQTVDDSTISSTTISPNGNGETIALIGANASALVYMAGNLQGSKTYTIEINDLEDACGNAAANPVSISFSTMAMAGVDLASCSPSGGETGVSTAISAVTIAYSENVNGAGGTYTISPNTNSETVTYNSTAGTDVTLNISNLQAATTYTISISGAVTDPGGDETTTSNLVFTTAP